VVLPQSLLEPQRLHLFGDLLVALSAQVGIELHMVVHLRVLLSFYPEPDMVTLVALLSREEGEGFPTCSGNFSRDIFPSLSNRARDLGFPYA
jgi:hypothetical protein